MSGKLDAILFDAGGVLVLPDPTVLAPLLAPFGGSTDVERHRRAHYAAMAAKSRSGAGEHDWAFFDRHYVESVGVDQHVDHAVELLGLTRTPLLWRWPIPDTVKALRRLAELGVPMGVVSNATGYIEADLMRHAVCQVGDGAGVAMRCVVDSHVVGVAKPDPKIFDFALAHFDGVEPARIGFVGDSVTMDVGGARAAGLHPILLDPYDDHVGGDFDRIRSVVDVLDWL